MSTNSNPVILCESDYKRLTAIIVLDKKTEEKDNTLAYELSRATVVKDEDFPENIIRIGSGVKILDIAAQKEKEFQIVMPGEADIQAKKISILTPMAAAIIGFKPGDEVSWKMPSGMKQLKVVSVDNKTLVKA
ncbi:GreA/GreB family elongation factor [Niabella drilacis]|uniref:Regulator of nucleoside diphosphate kinase n=1 Tax=Niabella drilacis (strain DSM 25811 / CCM 8410 / CCUG 62505 / LMG 26954 / E90) TaxID=1285928 RepID=A0A1G6MXF1_NIADE|nr:GreA/GreB family elongation factor [Niabella drilacis]SDC59666.1 regulator of nucleoside diphosphate kinase [Niabella drilacis]